ncbi:MAG: UbiX family flavin prenyltransferase [Desulfobacterales bacterium]|nr:UbiX family flavin prenyltransferase [Desulfobacterales bacterium]
MIVVAISGASGPILGIRLIEELLNAGKSVSAVVSDPAKKIIEYEIPDLEGHTDSLRNIIEKRGIAKETALFEEYDNRNFFSPAASGSTRIEATVVVPCSMKTLAAISHGYADTLITRSADVAIKEKHRLIIVPRETPMSIIHIENLQKVARAGADIVMPVPGFYTRPKTIEDTVDFIVGKILNLLDINHNLFKSWEELSKDLIQ